MNREQEFLALIEKHKGILYKVSRMYSDNDESQEDLFQEMLYQLWRSFSSFKKESQFSTWMYRVALNTAITSLKKEKRNPKTIALDHRLSVAEPETVSGRMELFYKAVQDLSKIEKAVVFLYLENYSHKAIGRQLGLSEGNARVRLPFNLPDSLQNLKGEQSPIAKIRTNMKLELVAQLAAVILGGVIPFWDEWNGQQKRVCMSCTMERS